MIIMNKTSFYKYDETLEELIKLLREDKESFDKLVELFGHEDDENWEEWL